MSSDSLCLVGAVPFSVQRRFLSAAQQVWQLRMFALVLLTLVGCLFLLAAFPARALAEDGEADLRRQQRAETEAALAEQSASNGVGNQQDHANIIEMYTWATILPKELIDLQNGLGKSRQLDAINEEFPKLREETGEVKAELWLARYSTGLQLMQTATFQSRIYRITGRLRKMAETVTATFRDYSKARTSWQTKRERLTQAAVGDDLSQALSSDEQDELLDTIDTAIGLIESHLKEITALGKQIGDLQVELYTAESDLHAIDEQLKNASIQERSPSILSPAFYKRINLNLLLQGFQLTYRFIANQFSLMRQNVDLVIGCGLGFLLVWGCFAWSVRLVPESSGWYPFAARAFATTVFIAASSSDFAAIMVLDFELPAQWQAMLHIFSLYGVIRLGKFLVLAPFYRKMINRLAMFTMLIMLAVIIGLPNVLILLYVFYGSMVALGYYIYQLKLIRTDMGKDEIWVRRLFGILPTVVLIPGLLGYDQFAVLAFSTLLSSGIAVLFIWIMYRFVMGFFDLLLIVLPLDLTLEQRTTAAGAVKPVIACLSLLFLVAVQGVVWKLYPTINDAVKGISNIGFDFGAIRVSPGFFLSVILVIYSAFLASRAVQALLINKLLPRYGARKGVQLSIARLAHYAILCIGFLVMLRVLGFELQQLTLLGGALGVGIGFGLQAIVNNFASGLILLFERPLKVGDTIQLGEDFGEVKELGLRATIIQTFDNAEIVVPNSDLITGQVVNWTLADRKVRVRVPIGVAYGSDVSKVMDILKSVGEANPMVLSNPKPLAYFLAFGNSSLDFELRVWIPEFLDKIQVLSELNIEIESELAAHNIEIPFPQTDLHIRSVDEEAARHMVHMVRMAGMAGIAGNPGTEQGAVAEKSTDQS